MPDAIKALRDAGLAVWVLTGDKLQTATEIGRSCNLIKKDDNVIFINHANRKDLCSQLKSLSEGASRKPSIKEQYPCLSFQWCSIQEQTVRPRTKGIIKFW